MLVNTEDDDVTLVPKGGAVVSPKTDDGADVETDSVSFFAGTEANDETSDAVSEPKSAGSEAEENTEAAVGGWPANA